MIRHFEARLPENDSRPLPTGQYFTSPRARQPVPKRGQPLLSLVSHVFLRDPERIIEQLTHTGHVDLLRYMLQQVQQFRRFGEDFAMQHQDSEYLGEVEAELGTAVLEAIPPEERLRGLPPEERLRGLPPEERLRGVSFDDLVLNLSEDQVAQLREALERRPGQKP